MKAPMSRTVNWKYILRLQCPNCGKSKLFVSYLKQAAICSECHVEWGKYRADDGPAWLTIIVLGHIIIPLAVYLALETEFETEWIMLGVCIVSTLLVLLLLPFSKAVFLAILWRTNAGALISKTSETPKNE